MKETLSGGGSVVAGVAAWGCGVNNASSLLCGTHVHPHNGVAQCLTVLIKGNDGHRRRIVGKTGDLKGLEAGTLHHRAGGRDEHPPDRHKDCSAQPGAG